MCDMKLQKSLNHDALCVRSTPLFASSIGLYIQCMNGKAVCMPLILLQSTMGVSSNTITIAHYLHTVQCGQCSRHLGLLTSAGLTQCLQMLFNLLHADKLTVCMHSVYRLTLSIYRCKAHWTMSIMFRLVKQAIKRL